MSAEAFEAVRQLVPKLSELGTDVARAVLVDGSTYQAAADRFGGTRQNAHKATTAVWEAYERFRRATLGAPSELIEQLRAKLQEEQDVGKTSGDTRGSRRAGPKNRQKKTRPANGEPG